MSKNLSQNLIDSTKLMQVMYDYAASMRRAVMDDPKTASKGGFTYLDLDTLDEVMVQIAVNYSTLGIKNPLRRKKNGRSG